MIDGVIAVSGVRAGECCIHVQDIAVVIEQLFSHDPINCYFSLCGNLFERNHIRVSHSPCHPAGEQIL
jgi:hypothetical protein